MKTPSRHHRYTNGGTDTEKLALDLAAVIIVVVTQIARVSSVDEVNRQSQIYERNARAVATALCDGS